MGIITCSNISKRFGNYTALDSVSVDIPKGRIFGLLGPNGAGKTTLIRIINRITVQDSGEVIFNGHPISGSDVEQIGYLPEERGLYKKMKVGEQAIYLARLKGLSTAQATKELKEWFIKFGIQAWWNKKVEELSKGMAQKVQFIITVLHRPSLLILDEPFSGFDPVNVNLIRNEILRLKDEGATIILSTHNMESVEELCDNIALINKSKLVISGGVDDIRRAYGSNQVELLYRGGSLQEKVARVAAEVGSAAFSFKVISDSEERGNRRALLELSASNSISDVKVANAMTIKSLADMVDIVSYREMMPRMNDIFISLVSK